MPQFESVKGGVLAQLQWSWGEGPFRKMLCTSAVIGWYV